MCVWEREKETLIVGSIFFWNIDPFKFSYVVLSQIISIQKWYDTGKI